LIFKVFDRKKTIITLMERAMEYKKLLTVKELSLIINVSEGTIYYYLSRNEIPHIKIGRHHRFSLEITLKWFAEKQFQNTLQRIDIRPYMESLRSFTTEERQEVDEKNGATIPHKKK
jgi:excisionase family DNA binding protein